MHTEERWKQAEPRVPAADHHLTPAQILRLAAHCDGPSVSIYVPAAMAGAEVQQTRIRLKNLLVGAEEHLSARMRPTLAKDFLHKALMLVNDIDFWNERCEGVALFVAPNLFRAYHLPFAVSERLVVAANFHVRPLLAELQQCASFDVLALDREDVRLVHADRFGAAEVHIDGMPHSFEAFFALDYSEKQHRTHSAGRLGQAGSTIGHGAGDPGADPKERLRRFCLAIDRAIVPHLNRTKDPLILAGTEEVQNAYRSVSRYPFLLPDGIAGAPKTFSLQSLAERAEPIADAYADRPRILAMEQYRRCAGTGLTSQQIEEILNAAHGGRVDSLLMAPDPPTWGWFDPVSGTVVVHVEFAGGDEDLVNRAALETLFHHGRVYVHPEHDGSFPDIAAVYRY